MDTLRAGMTGPDVLRWQTFLVGQSLMVGPTTSSFDDSTVEATKKFQQKFKLKADGIAGNKTIGQAQVLGFDVIGDPTASGKESPNWPPRPDFPPLVDNDERAGIFGKFAFVGDPQPRNPEHIRITDGWDKRNIVPVTLPQLVGIKAAPASGNVPCHRLVKDQLTRLWQEWADEGLLHLVKSWAGMYVPRFVRGSRTTLSNHAFGTAFDINAPWNRLGARPTLVGSEGSVRELVPIANKHGFYWGGHFSRQDGMHFEVAKLMS